MDLLLGGVEGEVADVERSSVAQFVFGRGGAAAVVVARVASALLRQCQYEDMILDFVAVSTFAVAYELGLSRRSMVLRNAGMLPNSRRFCGGLWEATAIPKSECRAESGVESVR